MAHHIFTDEEESNMVEFIKENFIKPGNLFTDAQFRELAMSTFFSNIKMKNKSPILWYPIILYMILKKEIIFLHPKRRSDSNEEQNIEWENYIGELLNTFPRDRILNCDETSWQISPNSLKTWAETGSQNIQIHVNGNPKDSITVLATITADGTKCPLFIVAKGKTERCEESQLGDTAYHFRSHSENGWSTTETFQEYLHYISNLYNNQPLHLLLDLHASHRGQQICEL